MVIDELPLSGCYLLQPNVFQDLRGRFVKPFVASQLAIAGLRTDFVEQYYSTSEVGVIRGMHFQTPPHDHAKLVYCASGAVCDVLLDLRKESPTFGKSFSTSLSSSNGRAVYIPSGIAHGFLASQGPALLIYNVTSEYAPQNDKGVRWDSFNFDWQTKLPLISQRDSLFPELMDFSSPF